jgi:hypothetical protein
MPTSYLRDRLGELDSEQARTLRSLSSARNQLANAQDEQTRQIFTNVVQQLSSQVEQTGRQRQNVITALDGPETVLRANREATLRDQERLFRDADSASLRSLSDSQRLDQQRAFSDAESASLRSLADNQRLDQDRLFREADAQSLRNLEEQTQRVVELTKNPNDWRCKIKLAPSATYLYKSDDSSVGILTPLRETDGVVFPYTPSIQTHYTANYTSQQLVHSNWMGHFYQGSSVGDISVSGLFTAQDTREAQYVLAVIHFFKSASKMFYGQDFERGAPPPVLFLSAFGEHHYNNMPCLLKDFNYSLPADVNYIPTLSSESVSITGNNESGRSPKGLFESISPALGRLASAGLRKGANEPPAPVVERSFERPRAPVVERSFSSDPLGDFISNLPGLQSPPPSSVISSSVSSSVNAPTTSISYVPTKLEITIALIPLQNREQMSKEFSLRDYASGKLITRGFY